MRRRVSTKLVRRSKNLNENSVFESTRMWRRSPSDLTHDYSSYAAFYELQSPLAAARRSAYKKAASAWLMAGGFF